MSATHQIVIPGTNVIYDSPMPVSPTLAMMAIYGNYHRWSINQPPEFPSKAWFFRKIAEAIWGEKNPICKFIWHPWAELMNEEAHKWKYLGFAGSGSSGKSEYAAIYGMINWMCAPTETKVFFTSTSLKDSRKRIWSKVVNYWNAAGGSQGLPGKLVDSMHIIRTNDHTGVFKDSSGIEVIAGEKKKERDSIGKLIGFKAKRVFLIADELPELSEALVEAATSNLSLNETGQDDGSQFQMLGLGNLYSMYDPMGTFVRPKHGWSSVTQNDTEWETERGYCLRFDGEKSPNILGGEDKWPIYNSKNLKEHRKDQGMDSIGYWRMCRSFIPPIGVDNIIYSEADLLAGGVEKKAIWLGSPRKVASLDPSFTTGGDRSVAIIGLLGRTTDGKMTLMFDKIKTLREEAGKTDMPRSQQIAQKFIDLCMQEKVQPEDSATDATAAGRILYDIICERWSRKVLAVEFGGSPSELPCTMNGNHTCKEAYDRRVSELWYAGLEFVRSGQMRGVTAEMANEMKARRYDLIKGASMKIRVEPKSEMKKRLGFSPDIYDAACVMIDLCRSRLGWTAGTQGKVRAGIRLSFKDRAKQLNSVYTNLYMGETETEKV